MTDWMSRTRMILEQGTGRPFARFDRYAQFEESRGKALPQLLNEFEAARSRNLESLRQINLQPVDLHRRGTHPSFGSVTLEQLLATWVAHDLNHLAQIAKAMATRYESAVGPWREYLGILKGPVTRMDEEGLRRQRIARAGLVHQAGKGFEA
jgi:hypothetical protein